MELQTTIVFLLALTRITAAILTAPVLGNRSVPLRFRLVLAILLTCTAMPLIQVDSMGGLQGWTTSMAASMLLSEIVIGSLLGFGIMIVFSAAQVAGTVIGQMAGIQISSSLDPQSGQPSSPVNQMFGILSLAAFALIGGPELVVTATLDTFANLPLGTTLQQSSVFALLGNLLQQSFILTLRGVAPAIAALMISTLVIGLISRTYPQMNLLSLGLSSNLMVMLLAIFFTLGGCVWLFADDLGNFMAMITDTLSQGQVAVEVSAYE
ncbi:MAG: flagellar biosynthetic protein FliR [Mariniblastus sp.]|nr:flagellar biosynthetic protein FliR [Mariniblastus sp.]